MTLGYHNTVWAFLLDWSLFLVLFSGQSQEIFFFFNEKTSLCVQTDISNSIEDYRDLLNFPDFTPASLLSPN